MNDAIAVRHSATIRSRTAGSTRSATGSSSAARNASSESSRVPPSHDSNRSTRSPAASPSRRTAPARTWTRGYGQYCPIALAAEVFAERWIPIIIRNLYLGCARFNDIIDGAPGLPRSVLSQRLRSLERIGVVQRAQSGRSTAYALSASGHELAQVCLALGAWGARWRQVRPEDQDPYLALWMLSRMIRPETLPRPRVVVRFDLPAHRPPNRFWLVLSSTGNEVCAEPPGFAEDGQITTDVASLIRWYAGEITLGAAQRGGMSVTAPAWLVKQLSAWGRLNPYAGPPLDLVER